MGSTYPEYLWHPEYLSMPQNSSYKLGKAFAAAVNDTRRVAEILQKDARLSNFTSEEVHALASGQSSSALASFFSEMISKRALISWATHGHSAVDVNLYSFGESSALLAGNHENTEIGEFIRDFLGVRNEMSACDEILKQAGNWSFDMEAPHPGLMHFHLKE